MRRMLATVLLALGLVAAPAFGQPAVPGEPAPGSAWVDLDARLGDALSTLERATTDRARAEAELAGLADARSAAQRRVRDRARALYRMRHAGALPLAGGFSALLSHLGRSARLSRMLENDLTSLEELRRRGDALSGEIARAETAGSEARDLVTRLENERRSAEIAGLEAALGASTFRGVVEHALGPGAAGTFVVHDAVGGAPDPAGAFESLRGTLTLPIASPHRITEEARDDGAALSFAASPGSRVRVASAGRVAYAGRHSAYGRLVIVDHGGSYFTVYGGLGTIAVSVGDELPAGAGIGAIDRDPLLFQVRRGTRALPPRPWLGL